MITAHFEALRCTEKSGLLHRVTGTVNSLGLLDARGRKSRPALPVAWKCRRKYPNIRRAMSFALFKQLGKEQERKGEEERIFF